MGNINLILFLVIPVSLFFSGFLAARQLRPLENVSTVSIIFVQRKWFLSITFGILASVVFTAIFSLATKSSTPLPLLVAGVFLLSTVSSYFGIRLGWGHSSASGPSVEPVDKMGIDQLPRKFIVEDTLTAIRITISTQKRWVWFVMALFRWAIFGLCIFPIIGFAIISVLQDFLPESLNFVTWIVVGCLVLYLIYMKFREVLEYIFDKEVIEIDNRSVKIEKSGLGFTRRKEYPAERIKKITTMFSVGGPNVGIGRSAFASTNLPAFMLWHKSGFRWYSSFGRAIDLADAQSILQSILARFPQYRGE